MLKPGKPALLRFRPVSYRIRMADSNAVRRKGTTVSLKINVRETPEAVILDLNGRVTLGEPLSELRDSIREALAGDQRNILLNLADVTYIDSSGLGQLIGSYAGVANRGGQMKLLNLQKRVQDLMQVTKLLTVFDAYTSEQTALRSFSQKKTAAP